MNLFRIRNNIWVQAERKQFMIKTHGIHHITSMVGHPQRNIDYYSGVLGYRLVKQTLNYDDQDTFHFYYGNESASSGLVTTFPFNDGKKGQLGGGQVAVASYGIRSENFEFWRERLKSFGIKSFYYTRFNQKRLGFQDLDGLQLELIETDKGPINQWEFNGINKDQAIIGVQSAVLSSAKPQETLEVLTDLLGYQVIDEDQENYLLEINDEFGGQLELSKKENPWGQMGVGIVHHIAFKINDEDLHLWLSKLRNAGYKSSTIRDRKYFKSLYFREPGGILIELATKGPGMLVDEDINSLGINLMIPEHFKNIEDENRIPIFIREVEKLEGYGYRDKAEYEHLQIREKIKSELLELKNKEQLTQQELQRLETLKKLYTNKKGEY